MRTRREAIGCGLILLSAMATAWAENLSQPDFSVPPGMVSRDFPLGVADLGTVEQMCRDTLAKGGKYFVFPATRKVRVIGRPEEVETIRQMLPHLNQPAANVKIEFRSRTVSNDSLRGLQVSGGGRGRIGNVIIDGGIPRTPGRVSPNGVTVSGPRGAGAIDIDLLHQSGGGSNLSSQFILVQSGREGFIEVARDVPMIDYFTRFVADGGYGAVLGIVPSVTGNPDLLILRSGHFEVPQIRWEKAGARLLVQPVVEGSLVHVSLMPQISAIRIVDPEVFRTRGLNTFLTGREQYVTYTQLATSVTVQSGQEVTLGGFEKADPEFSRCFFGGMAGSSSTAGSFTLRATIQ